MLVLLFSCSVAEPSNDGHSKRSVYAELAEFEAGRPLRSRPAGFETGRPDLQREETSGRLRSRLARFKTSVEASLIHNGTSVPKTVLIILG